jgi:hypothetical protein
VGGGGGRRGGAFTSEKRGEWYPQIDMAAGPSSRRRHGRKQGQEGLLLSFVFFFLVLSTRHGAT